MRRGREKGGLLSGDLQFIHQSRFASEAPRKMAKDRTMRRREKTAMGRPNPSASAIVIQRSGAAYGPA